MLSISTCSFSAWSNSAAEGRSAVWPFTLHVRTYPQTAAHHLLYRELHLDIVMDQPNAELGTFGIFEFFQL